MPKIRFFESRETPKQQFEKGKVYDLSESAAHHWVSRRIAERVEDGPSKTAEVATFEGDEVATLDSPKRAKRKAAK